MIQPKLKGSRIKLRIISLRHERGNLDSINGRVQVWSFGLLGNDGGPGPLMWTYPGREKCFEPHPAAARPQQALGPGAGRTGAPLQARASRRDHPHRHQKSSVVSSKSVTASLAIAKAKTTAAGWLGISAFGDRRPLPRGLLGNLARRKTSLLPCAFSLTRCASSGRMAFRFNTS